MVLQEKEDSIWEARQTQTPNIIPLCHESMGGGLLGYLLTSGTLGVFKGHAYYDSSQRAPHQVSIFCSSIHPGCCKIIDIHGTPHRFWG